MSETINKEELLNALSDRKAELRKVKAAAEIVLPDVAAKYDAQIYELIIVQGMIRSGDYKSTPPIEEDDND